MLKGQPFPRHILGGLKAFMVLLFHKVKRDIKEIYSKHWHEHQDDKKTKSHAHKKDSSIWLQFIFH